MSYRQVLANEATASKRRACFHLVDATDGITAETGETGGQPQVSDDGAAWTNTGIGTLSSVGSGEYTADLTQTIVATAGHFIRTRYKSAATAEARGTEFQVLGYDPSAALATSAALSTVQADTDDIQTRLPAALVSGRMDSSVGAMAANVLTATAINAGAITSAKFAAGAIDATAIAADAIGASQIAADAIGSSELATSAVTEIQTGLATSAALATVQADTDDIQTRLPAALVSGRIDASVGAMAANVLTATAIAADAITAAKIAPDAIGASELAADAATEIAGQVWEQNLPSHLNTDTTGAALDNARTSAALVTQAHQAIVGAIGAVTGGTATIVQTDISHINNDFDGLQLVINNPTHGGVARRITAYSNTNGAFTVTPAFPFTPAFGDVAVVVARVYPPTVAEVQAGLATAAALAVVQADTDDIQTRLPAALVGGRMDSSVGAMATDVITAAAIATDAIGSAELAASAVTEIQTGLATAAALALVQADTDDIQARLPAALVGGRIDASVGAMAAGTVTAAAIATDAIDADAIAANAVTEIQSGLATAASIVTLQADTDDIQARLPAALVSGRIDASVGAMAAGTITAAAVATGAIDADALATDAVNEIVDQVWDELIAGHAGVGSTGEALTTAAAGGSGLTAQQVRDAMKLAPTVGAPAAGSIDEAVDTLQLDTDDIQTRLPAALVSGRIDASVGAMATDVITAAAIATDAIGSAELAASAVTEIQTGLATAAALATVQADTDDIQTRLPATLSGGRMRSQVEAIDAGAITAAATAADFSAEAATDTQTGLTAQGYTAARSVKLDQLDVAVSTRATPAQVNTEVDTALADIRLDELVQNVASPATPTIDSFVDRITSKNGGQTFDRSTDSLEAIADTGGGGPTVGQIADGVWDELIAGHAIVGSTGEALSNAAAGGAGLTSQQVRDAMKLAPTAGLPAAGSIDEELDDILTDTSAMQPLIDVATSTRAAPGDAMDLVANAIDAAALDPSGDAEIAAAVDATLTGAHGAGAWGGAGAPSAAVIAAAVWDESNVAHLIAGSTGKSLADAAACSGGGGSGGNDVNIEGI